MGDAHLAYLYVHQLSGVLKVMPTLLPQYYIRMAQEIPNIKEKLCKSI